MTGVSAFLFFSQAHNHHKHGRKDADAYKTKRKDIPTYPEPEGDPSY